ncbi:MAG: hypothetical protein Q8O26_18555 [Phreatobacter sp.]|uniref:hypothetical protein n=1 Tax=Phreatobacter sp. TaxID=1966341 RepID=UPI002735596D|nr:hypothetical protein [Phreatobacter sp.]MDP2803878.1 hypothetical protein [Phreatobacter sp.]
MASLGGRRWTGSDKVRRQTAAMPPTHVGREEVAAHLAKPAGEMVELARAADLHLVAHLADMTRLEAEKQARLRRWPGGTGPPPQSSETRPPGSR